MYPIGGLENVVGRYSLCMRVTEEDGVPVCEETWSVPQHRVLYGAFTNIAQVRLVPLSYQL